MCGNQTQSRDGNDVLEIECIREKERVRAGGIRHLESREPGATASRISPATGHVTDQSVWSFSKDDLRSTKANPGYTFLISS
ncbi:hypothetical protein RRG08_018342 [Elysia crispata]|uniref:Uncharacterized protein n=1 Tax=Elysia crispata TaxID=231223 RepID=A0AAE1CQ31_9GAST|nr:hypothetical protein RRG08_018342 [Elysia crispata]